MKKTMQHLEEYTLKFLDKIIIDIQTYEESILKIDSSNSYYRLYSNSTLSYFILSLRNIIDKKGDEKSSISIFLKVFRKEILKNNPLGANENFIQNLENRIQTIRENPAINKYFAHLNTDYFNQIITGQELPDINEVLYDLKYIIGEFTKLIYGTNWVLKKRQEINIGII